MSTQPGSISPQALIRELSQSMINQIHLLQAVGQSFTIEKREDEKRVEIMSNSTESKKLSVFLSLALRFFIAMAIGVAVLAFMIGMFLYNTHRDWSDFTLRRTEVTEQVSAIYEFWKEHNRYPKDLSEEVGVTLPPEWEYRYFEENPPLLLLASGKRWLKFYFDEEGSGVWAFYVEGSRMKWSKIARPLPSDPKDGVGRKTTRKN